jgi:hypothetical protein
MSTRRSLVALCGAAMRPRPSPRSWRNVLGMLTGFAFLLTSLGEAASTPLKSIVPMVLDQTVVDDETGQDVILFGLFHVQTTVYPSDSAVTIHANVTGEFVAYSPPKPTSEFSPESPSRADGSPRLSPKRSRADGRGALQEAQDARSQGHRVPQPK